MGREEGLGKARVPFHLLWDPVRNLVLQTCVLRLCCHCPCMTFIPLGPSLLKAESP